MSKLERERRHQASLDRINQVQRVVGYGDRTRIDHEATVFERARMLAEEIGSHDATERGLAALDRLLRVAEERGPRQSRDIAVFLAAIWSNAPLPLRTLRGLDAAVGDDMLAVLDAFRYARLDLAQHVEGGPARVARIVNRKSVAST